MTYHNTAISAGVICQDKSKYTLVCYTDKELSQNQLNSVTNFSKQPPQKMMFKVNGKTLIYQL